MSLKSQDPGIACVACGSLDHRVKDSRTHENRVYRRRECKACGVRFSTIEEPVAESGRGVGVVTHHEKLTEAVTSFIAAFSNLVELTGAKPGPAAFERLPSDDLPTIRPL